MDIPFNVVEIAFFFIPLLVIYIYFAQMKQLFYPALQLSGKVVKLKKGWVNTEDTLNEYSYKNYTVKVGFVLDDEYVEIEKAELFFKQIAVGDMVDIIVNRKELSKSAIYKDYNQYKRNAGIFGTIVVVLFIASNYGLYAKLLKDISN